MSYAVYTTRGFVLGSSPAGEASKLYSIYTEDFGLILAKAQGVRLVASKLRYNLEEYSLATLSLVRGREVWRLTGAAEKVADPHTARIRARVLTLVRRLVQGEEKNPALFDALQFMTTGVPEGGKPEDFAGFELVILLRALASLGYVDDKLAALSISEAASRKAELVAEINKALKESQL